MSNRKFTFGKYKGHDVESVINKDPRYVKWVVDNVNYFTLSPAQKRNLGEELEKIEHNREVRHLMRRFGMHAIEAIDFIEYDYPEYY